MKQFNTLTTRMVKLAEQNGMLDKVFGESVNRLIREKYTISEEMAIHRHFLRGEHESEFNEYNAYCEECKRVVAEEMERLLRS